MILDNKVVIVSGIGPGLGQELAYGAAREGAKLVIAARCKIYSSSSGNICRSKSNHLQKDQCQYWHQLPQEWQY